MSATELVLELDFVDLEISADQDGNKILVGFEDQGLDQVRRRYAEERGYFFDRAHLRGMDRLGSVAAIEWPIRRRRYRTRLRFLHVRTVVAVWAREDCIFPGVGEDHEFVRLGTADITGVGLDLGIAETATFKYPAVSLLHRAVGFVEVFGVGVEGVGVLHDEFSTTHETKPGPYFVAEFGLDLEEVDRQLAIRRNGSSHHVGNHFLVCRTEAEISFVAVVHPQQLRPVLEPPS